MCLKIDFFHSVIECQSARAHEPWWDTHTHTHTFRILWDKSSGVCIVGSFRIEALIKAHFWEWSSLLDTLWESQLMLDDWTKATKRNLLDYHWLMVCKRASLRASAVQCDSKSVFLLMDTRGGHTQTIQPNAPPQLHISIHGMMNLTVVAVIPLFT